jgi:hypothetical protein
MKPMRALALSAAPRAAVASLYYVYSRYRTGSE